MKKCYSNVVKLLALEYEKLFKNYNVRETVKTCFMGLGKLMLLTTLLRDMQIINMIKMTRLT